MTEPKFDKPLGQWIDEMVDVKVMEPVLSPDGKKLERIDTKIEKQAQRTIYLEQQVAFQSCENGDHYWLMKDQNRFLFECSKCHLGKVAVPWLYSWDDGKLTKI